jgi:ribokinase
MSKTVYDIITIGDTTVDVFLDIDESTKLCKLDADKEWLCLKYAAKIPVKHVNKVVGVGNSANVAVGTRRLGLKTAIYTVLGDDAKGREIYKKFEKNKIGVEYIEMDRDTDTNMSAVIDYKDDRTILVHHEDRKYKLPKMPPPKWIYFSSVCGNHDVINKKISEYVAKHKIKLCFNPGSMQLILGIERLASILESCEIVFLNVREAEHLTKKTKDIKKLLQAVKQLGPKIVVITDGTKGSYSFDGECMFQVGVIELPKLEKTGCGDAYASGFISAMAYGLDIKEAMRWGSANGAHAAVEIGSQDGLLDRTKLEKLLRRHTHFQPSKM